MSGGSRASAMAERVMASSRRTGIDGAAALRGRALFERVVDYRLAAVSDEHDPDYLHPGRTALILLDDLHTRDATCIAAGIALDSVQPGRNPDAELLIAWGEPDAAALLHELGLGAEDDERVEALVAASEHARTVALAERLDHARHLHLRDAREWRAFHDLIVQLYLPLAARTNPVLERRYQWWSRMFARRFLSA